MGNKRILISEKCCKRNKMMWEGRMTGWGGGASFDRWLGKGSLKKCHPSWDLHDKQQGIMGESALRWGQGWWTPGSEGSRAWGWMGAEWQETEAAARFHRALKAKVTRGFNLWRMWSKRVMWRELPVKTPCGHWVMAGRPGIVGITQARDEGGLGWGISGNGEKWMDLGCSLEAGLKA